MDFSFLNKLEGPGSVKLKTRVANAIRNSIIQGELKPGQQLQQDKIAAAMGVSSIPVREALAALKEEQHVVHYPNRGMFVAKINADKVREAFEIRFFLESGALTLSLPHMPLEQFETIRDIMVLTDQEDNDATQKAIYDLKFHKTLCDPGNRPHLMGLIDQIHTHTARYVNLSIYLMNFQQHPMFHHGELLAACEKRHVTEAVRILKNHLQVASDLICQKFEA